VSQLSVSGNIIHVVFALSMLVSLLALFDSLFQSKARWRQLRSSAHSIESLLWFNRTRVRAFEVKEAQLDSNRHVTELSTALNNVRDKLMAGASISSSSLQKKYPPKVYTHFQYTGQHGVDLLGAGADHYQSPVQPYRYITLRIALALAFYQNPIRMYVRYSSVLQVTTILLGLGLARYELLSFVVVLTSAACALTTCIGFSDITRKVERYSNAVNSFKKPLGLWKVQSQVPKGSKDTITTLITSSESMLSDERLAWMSTAKKQDDVEDSAHVDNGATKGKSEKVAQIDD